MEEFTEGNLRLTAEHNGEAFMFIIYKDGKQIDRMWARSAPDYITQGIWLSNNNASIFSSRLSKWLHEEDQRKRWNLP